MKTDRQSVILSIIQDRPIQTQQQLLEALAERGISCTQGTLSRDIKQLHLVKFPMEDGKQRYTADTGAVSSEQLKKLTQISRQGVVSFKLAENLIIVKTLPGFASGVGSYLDKLNLEHVLVTLARHDTVLIAMTDSRTAQALYRDLRAAF